MKIADAFLKSAISLIPDIQRQIEANQALNISNSSMNYDGTNLRLNTLTASMPMVEKFLNDYLSNMMSTLLLIPDSPEQGVLYLLTGVLNMINQFNWDNLEIKFNLLANALVIFSALEQENYFYFVTNGIFFIILQYKIIMKIF